MENVLFASERKFEKFSQSNVVGQKTSRTRFEFDRTLNFLMVFHLKFVDYFTTYIAEIIMLVILMKVLLMKRNFFNQF